MSEQVYRYAGTLENGDSLFITDYKSLLTEDMVKNRISHLVDVKLNELRLKRPSTIHISIDVVPETKIEEA